MDNETTIHNDNGELSHIKPSPGRGRVAPPLATTGGAFLFDYGGTLDTNGCHWGQMLWHAYQRQEVPVSEKLFRDAYVYGERTIAAQPLIKPDYTFHRTLDIKIRLEMEYLCAYGWEADETEMKRKHDAVLEDLYAKVQTITKMSGKVLAQLQEEHHPMAVVSNFYGNLRTVLREFHLDSYFQDVIESSEVGIRKPDPRLWLLGVNSLGVKPKDTIVVGDSFYKDIEPAIKAGCHAIWLKGEGWTKKNYDEKVPDKVITDLRKITGLPLAPSKGGGKSGN